MVNVKGSSLQATVTVNCQLSTANHDIQHHHQNESQRKSDSADVAMFTFRCLGNQFFHHYINPNRSLGHFVALS